MEVIKGFLSPSSLHPPKGRVLIEALFPEKSGSLLLSIDSDFNKRYSCLGRVVTGGSEEGIEPGHLVILEDNGKEVFNHYYDSFILTLNDEGRELRLVVEIEAEPLLRERMLEFQANPSTNNRKLSVYDLEGKGWYSFDCSDVLDWGIEQIANKNWRLEEIPTFMIHLWSQEDGIFKLHYIAPVGSIMAILGE